MTNCRNEKTALLDKLVLSNITIVDIEDMQSLIDSGVIEINTQKIKYVTASGQEFSRLRIVGDGLIDELTASSMRTGNSRKDYCNLTTTIHNKDSGNLNCYTVSEYYDHLYSIMEHLQSKYGITIDLSDATLKEVEVNRTFKLEHDFEEYYRPCQLIMRQLPYYMNQQKDCKQKTAEGVEYQTFYAFSTTRKSDSDVIAKSKSKRCMVFKIYNKSKALHNIILLSDSYMRVELRLIGTERIKRAFGSNRFADLTDQTLNEFYDKQIEKLIIKPLEKWRAERDKKLLRLLNEQKESNSKHWITGVLRLLQNEEIANKCPTVLDVEEITAAVSKMNLKKNRKYDVKKAFCIQAKKYEDVFTNNDHKKLREIIDKLTVKDDKKSTEFHNDSTVVGGTLKKSA